MSMTAEGKRESSKSTVPVHQIAFEIVKLDTQCSVLCYVQNDVKTYV